jgi:hypothetical protein
MNPKIYPILKCIRPIRAVATIRVITRCVLCTGYVIISPPIGDANKLMVEKPGIRPGSITVSSPS